MLMIVGAVVVLVSVAGGFMLAGGNLLALVQPAEYIVIVGAAIGTMIVSTPIAVLHQMVAQVTRLFRPGPGKEDYVKLLAMQYQLFRVVQQNGMMALESHFDNPAQSPILSRYPTFLGRPGSVAFLADSVKVLIVGGIASHDFEQLMNEDLEVRLKEESEAAHMLNKVSDALPGLGIVAAVLGVVVTMASIDGPASEIGHKVGAALVGTFLGILLSYGFVGPVATSLEHRAHEEAQYDVCVRAGLLATTKGLGPVVAIEFARRTIPDHVRPTFEETEALCRATRAEAQAAA